MPDQVDLRTPWQKAQAPYVRLRRWWQWRRQGSPRDFPVIVETGQLIRRTDGRKIVWGWHFDLNWMQSPIDPESLWDEMARRYPATIVDRK